MNIPLNLPLTLLFATSSSLPPPVCRCEHLPLCVSACEGEVGISHTLLRTTPGTRGAAVQLRSRLKLRYCPSWSQWSHSCLLENLCPITTQRNLPLEDKHTHTRQSIIYSVKQDTAPFIYQLSKVVLSLFSIPGSVFSFSLPFKNTLPRDTGRVFPLRKI